MKHADLFDGELHELLPDEDFIEVTREIVDWEPTARVEELDPYELPTQRPIFKDLPQHEDERFPNASIERGWGHFSVAMAVLCNILDVGRDQYQHNHLDDNGWLARISFTFQTKSSIEGRL